MGASPLLGVAVFSKLWNRYTLDLVVRQFYCFVCVCVCERERESGQGSGVMTAACMRALLTYFTLCFILRSYTEHVLLCHDCYVHI